MKHQSGNVLFLILITIVLFAALSFAVTNSNRGTGDYDQERKLLAVGEVVEYVAEIGKAIEKLRAIGDCSDDEISFLYDSDGDGTLETDGSDDYYNATAPADHSCDVFHLNGGGLSYEAPPPVTTTGNAGSWVFMTPAILGVGSDDNPVNGERSDNDLVAILQNVDPEVCYQLNKRLDSLNGSGDAYEDVNTWTTSLFDGTYTLGPRLGDDAENFEGFRSACFKEEASNTYHFYHVLIVR